MTFWKGWLAHGWNADDLESRLIARVATVPAFILYAWHYFFEGCAWGPDSDGQEATP